MNKSINRAVAIALAMGGAIASQNALAVLPGAFSASDITDNVLYFSGATATDTQVENLLRVVGSPVCTGGNIHIFRGNDPSQGTHRAILCTGPAGNTALIKESTKGSANGSVGVSSAAPVVNNFIDVFNGAMVCNGADNNAATDDPGEFNTPGANAARVMSTTGGLQATDEYLNCNNSITTHVLEAGISDVEAGLLGTNGGNAVATGQSQIVFGVPVSLNLYRALQNAQGILARPECDGVNDGTTARLQNGEASAGVGKDDVDGSNATTGRNTERDTPACVPSLPASVIAGLYKGEISSWDEIKFNGNPLSSYALSAPTNTNVHICRRGSTSGSQIATQVYFLNQGCKSQDSFKAPGPLPAATCGDPLDGKTYASNTCAVFAGAGTGDVLSCLDDRDDQKRWALGVASTENVVTTTVTLTNNGGIVDTIGNLGGDGNDASELFAGSVATPAEAYSRELRFIAVDGFSPSLDAVANGGYNFYAENVCYLRNAGVGAVSGAARLAIYSEICGPTGISAETKVRALNEGFDSQPWGDGGNLAIPGKAGTTNTPNAGLASLLALEGNAVSGWTKSISGTVNNCTASEPFTNDVQGTPPAGRVLPEGATP
jgi:hypothetical protein